MFKRCQKHALTPGLQCDGEFRGHDHFYAKQDLDGIIYQEVPQPGNPSNETLPRNAAEYGYRSGALLGGSGCLRVRVMLGQTTVEYRCCGGREFKIAHSYAITASRAK